MQWGLDTDQVTGSHCNQLPSICTGGDCPSGTSGTVKSPSYPSNYPHNQHVSSPLKVAAGSAIELTFSAVDIEPHASCDYDYVQVLNSDNSQMVKVCGTNKPTTLKSSGNQMTVVFHSDGSVNAKGFTADWKSVAAATTPTSGSLTSPNYPENYPDNLNMKEYKITVAAGKKIELTIDDLDIETESSCGYDSLKVYNTPASGARTLISVSNSCR